MTLNDSLTSCIINELSTWFRRVKLRSHHAETLLATLMKRWVAFCFVLSLTVADKDAYQIHTMLHIMLHTSDNLRGLCPDSLTTNMWVLLM